MLARAILLLRTCGFYLQDTPHGKRRDGPVALSDGLCPHDRWIRGKSMPLDEPRWHFMHIHGVMDTVYHPDEKVHRVRYTDSTQILES